MRDFIKENLRIQLEGRLARHTSSNVHQDRGLGDTKSINRMDENEWENEINMATEIYNNYDDIMGSTSDGNGLYEFVLYREEGNFVLKPKENSTGRKRESGDVNKSNNSVYMYMKASKPDEDIPELRDFMAPKIGKQSEKYTISATDIAYVKILALMGNTIKDFIDGTLGYTTSDAQKMSAEKTAPEDMYRFKKFEKDKKNNPNFRRKDVISINEPDKLESREYKDALRKYENLLPLYLEKSNKGEDITAIKATMDGFKAIIDKINPNYGK